MRLFQAVCTTCGATSPMFKHYGFAKASKHDCVLACRTCGWRRSSHGKRRECATCFMARQSAQVGAA